MSSQSAQKRKRDITKVFICLPGHCLNISSILRSNQRIKLKDNFHLRVIYSILILPKRFMQIFLFLKLESVDMFNFRAVIIVQKKCWYHVIVIYSFVTLTKHFMQ